MANKTQIPEKISVVTGNIIDMARKGEIDVLVHGCNCYCNMDYGLSREISNMFPKCQDEDWKTKPADREKMGTYSYVTYKLHNDKKLYIINAYIRYGCTKSDSAIDYVSFRYIMRQLHNDFEGLTIGMPKFSHYEWDNLFPIICEELNDDKVLIVMKPERKEKKLEL
jgi:O-acetyl-ADP-ribose deacetylase (regulator of RNase III)